MWKNEGQIIADFVIKISSFVKFRGKKKTIASIKQAHFKNVLEYADY